MVLAPTRELAQQVRLDLWLCFFSCAHVIDLVLNWGSIKHLDYRNLEPLTNWARWCLSGGPFSSQSARYHESDCHVVGNYLFIYFYLAY